MTEKHLTSWDIIKAKFVQHKEPKTVGYIMAVLGATKLFVSLRSYLSDLKQAEEKLNKDKDVTTALHAGDLEKTYREAGF